MSLYSMFKTDGNLEKNGVILEFGTNQKGLPIGIRIARAGGGNSAFTKRIEVLVKPYRRAIQNETIDTETLERLYRQAYAETVVLGWENVDDENNEPLEFTKENCIKLFEELPELFKEIQEQSQKVAIFREEILGIESKN